MNFFEKVYLVCNRIPSGKVASYGQIAVIIGSPRMARQVGWALNKSPEHVSPPAHRVVNRLGVLSGAGAFSMEHEQEFLLAKEGVIVKDGKVEMKKYGWKPSMEELEEINHLLNDGTIIF